MSRYVIITNVWGRKPEKYCLWDSKNIRKNPMFVEEEKYEFNTIEELNEFILLFTETCKDYDKPKIEVTKSYRSRQNYKTPIYDSINVRNWGYVWGDRELMTYKFGEDGLAKHSNKTDRRIIYDILFRREDEIPKNYQWDDGEYEGWLQFRWGDGKNAVGYEEPEKKSVKKNNEDDFFEDEDYDVSTYAGIDEYEADEIENQYLKEEDQEKLRRLMDRW